MLINHTSSDSVRYLPVQNPPRNDEISRYLKETKETKVIADSTRFQFRMLEMRVYVFLAQDFAEKVTIKEIQEIFI